MFIKVFNIIKLRFGDLYYGIVERLSDLVFMYLELCNFD